MPGSGWLAGASHGRQFRAAIIQRSTPKWASSLFIRFDSRRSRLARPFVAGCADCFPQPLAAPRQWREAGDGTEPSVRPGKREKTGHARPQRRQQSLKITALLAMTRHGSWRTLLSRPWSPCQNLAGFRQFQLLTAIPAVQIPRQGSRRHFGGPSAITQASSKR